MHTKKDATGHEAGDRARDPQSLYAREQGEVEEQVLGWYVVVAARRRRAARGEPTPAGDPQVIPLHRKDGTTS